MGLAVSQLDTLDATDCMARSWLHWTPRGNKRTCFQNDNAHYNMQCSSGLRYTICPKEETATSEPTALDPTIDPSQELDVEANGHLCARLEGDKQKEVISTIVQNHAQ